MYDRTILFSNFHPSQISKVRSIALPETPVTVLFFTSFFSAFSRGFAQSLLLRRSGKTRSGSEDRKIAGAAAVHRFTRFTPVVIEVARPSFWPAVTQQICSVL